MAVGAGTTAEKGEVKLKIVEGENEVEEAGNPPVLVGEMSVAVKFPPPPPKVPFPPPPPKVPF